MKLHEFIKENKKTIDDAAKELKVSPITIYRYINGNRYPDPDNLQKIFDWSGGKVTPNDFYLAVTPLNDNEIPDIVA